VVVDLEVLDILNLLHSSCCCMSSGMEGSGGCNMMEVVVGMARCSSSSRFAVAAAVLVLLTIGPVASQTQAQYSNAGKDGAEL
jgi:hypothetical protein